MTPRSISAIIFSVIVAIEVLMFIYQPEIEKKVRNGQPVGSFSGYDYVTDYEAQSQRNTKFMVVIGSTILMGALVTLNLSNKKIEPKQKNDTELKE